MIVAEQFARNLIRCRRLASLSQEEVGIRASLHRTEVSNLERGLRVARIDTLVKLAGAVEVTPCDLLIGVEWLPTQTHYGRFSFAERASPEG